MAKTKVHGEYLQDSVVRFTAKAGENITKGQPVYISGISGELPVVSLADADDTAKMPAFGLAEATVSTNDELEVTSFGTLAGLDTSTPGYSLGDILYVDTTAGALTNDPAGLEATKLQNIGIVQRVHASNGSIKVGGAGRTNAVPNLNDGDIFIGDANNKAVSSSLTTEIESYLDGGASSPVLASLIVDTDTLYVDSTNNRVGIGTTSPSSALDVTGTIQSASATQSALYLSNATKTTGFLVGRSLSSNDAQDFFIYDVTAASTRLAIDSSGNCGIGTSSTSAEVPLTVYYSDTSQFNIGGLQAGISNNIYYNGSAWANRNSSAGGGILQIGTDGTFAFRRATSGASPTLSYSAYIDGSGNVGIGMSSPGEKLQIAGDVRVQDVSADSSLQVFAPTDSYAPFIHWAVAGIRNSGVLGFPAGDDALVYRSGASSMTDGTERLRILSSGGITFNGDTAAANALDDYEEGTWEPVCYLTGQSAIYPVGSNYKGRYQKIGAYVHYQIYARYNFSGTGNYSGGVQISLPFAAGVGTGGENYNAHYISYADYFTASDTKLGGYQVAGNARVYIGAENTSGTISNLALSTASSAGIMIAGFYNTESV